MPYFNSNSVSSYANEYLVLKEFFQGFLAHIIKVASCCVYLASFVKQNRFGIYFQSSGIAVVTSLRGRPPRLSEVDDASRLPL